MFESSTEAEIASLPDGALHFTPLFISYVLNGTIKPDSSILDSRKMKLFKDNGFMKSISKELGSEDKHSKTHENMLSKEIEQGKCFYYFLDRSRVDKSSGSNYAELFDYLLPVLQLERSPEKDEIALIKIKGVRQ